MTRFRHVAILVAVLVVACGHSGTDASVTEVDVSIGFGDAADDGAGDTALPDVFSDTENGQNDTTADNDATSCDPAGGVYCDGEAVIVCDSTGVVAARFECGRREDCIDGECVDRPCDETDDFCIDDRVIARCDPDADAFFEEECHPQLVCADDACVFETGANACEGDEILDALPGDSCGDCGAFVCDPDDDNLVTCDDPGLNACGGCDTIVQTLGSECGTCGVWECGGGTAVCNDPGANACGWCGTLEGEPGDACGDCGTWACDEGGFLSERGVACDDPGANRCGGCTELPTFPGDLCDADGEVYVCSGGDGLRCQRNLTDSCFTAIECNIFATQFGISDPLRLACDDQVGCYLKANCSPDGVPTPADPFGSACVGGSTCSVVPVIDIQICTGCTVGDPSTCRDGEECQDLFGIFTICADPLFSLP